MIGLIGIAVGEDLNFVITLNVTDTIHLPKPINAVLLDQQNYEVDKRVAEEFPLNPTALIKIQSSDLVRLSKDDPTFTVKSSNRGH